jgi:hypothetical protein
MTTTNQKTKKATATIAPTGYGSFGIWWTGMPFPYSGPFETREAAQERAKDIAEYWERCEPHGSCTFIDADSKPGLVADDD